MRSFILTFVFLTHFSFGGWGVSKVLDSNDDDYERYHPFLNYRYKDDTSVNVKLRDSGYDMWLVQTKTELEKYNFEMITVVGSDYRKIPKDVVSVVRLIPTVKIPIVSFTIKKEELNKYYIFVGEESPSDGGSSFILPLKSFEIRPSDDRYSRYQLEIHTLEYLGKDKEAAELKAEFKEFKKDYKPLKKKEK